MIVPVILSGGSGTRLWPLSRSSFPKQFLAIGGGRSLLEEAALRVSGEGFAPPLAVSNEEQRFLIAHHLLLAGVSPARILLEPSARNTASAAAAARTAATGYSNLELDLRSGERGRRTGYLLDLLASSTGAESALVVNNNAGALVLVLATLASEREVIISRGELIEIGGSYRLPEVVAAGGAILREVGTTNRTVVGDYERAIGAETALILKVHRSNFFMGGFVESPSTEKLSSLARKKRLPLVEDLGSGAVAATERLA